MAQPIFIILSAPQMFGFMAGQPRRLREMGYAPFVVAAASKELDQRLESEGVARIIAPMTREISALSDVSAIFSLCMYIIRYRPAAVLLSGPKAIFLGGIAAWICDVPKRVIVYHGMRQENERGLKRLLLDCCDRLSFALATKVLAVSNSLKQLLIGRRLLAESHVIVTGPGTANGMNMVYFRHSPGIDAESRSLRAKHDLRPGAPIIGFVGRVTEDKGIADLYDAFKVIRQSIPGAKLLIVGPYEMRSSSGRLLLDELRQDLSVVCVGHVGDVRPYLRLIDVHAFPSHREGFGMAILEAAAFSIPTVAYDVTGCRDAIIDMQTGRLIPRCAIDAFAQALMAYLLDRSSLALHGERAKRRVEMVFSPENVWPAYVSALGETA